MSKVMREITMFESWAQNISEGTWAMPNSPESWERLKGILKQELPVGIDATNATEVLYDIIGDDTLYDQLGDLAIAEPEADARTTVVDWMKDNGLTIDIDDEMQSILMNI